MGQGRLLHSFCVHLLLVALAIQGITPDPHDLASINALKILCPTLPGSDQPLDADDFPDEICEPFPIKLDAARWDGPRSNLLPCASLSVADTQSATLTSHPTQLARTSGSFIPLKGRGPRQHPLVC
jgi:hypothetical protein